MKHNNESISRLDEYIHKNPADNIYQESKIIIREMKKRHSDGITHNMLDMLGLIIDNFHRHCNAWEIPHWKSKQ